MQDGKNAFRDFFLRFQFKSNTTEAEIQDTGATNALIAENCVSVCAGHGDTFGLARHGIDARGRRYGESVAA